MNATLIPRNVILRPMRAAVPRFYLEGPKGRHYVFIDLGDSLRVRKYQDQWLTEDREMPRPRARSLWAWLKKLGYTSW